MRRWRVVVSVAVALGVVAAAAGFVYAREGGNGGVAKGAYVEANEMVLRGLPVFPGGRLTETRSAPYYSGDSADAPVAGYTTTYVYELPADASAQAVSAFYEQRLTGGWLLVEKVPAEPPAGPVLNFRRGEAAVSVNLENAPAGQLEVTADHDSDGKPGV